MTALANLYRFTEDDGATVWTFTDSDIEHTYDAGDGVETYVPTSISRSEITVKNDLKRANLDINLPLTNAAAISWMSTMGELLVWLTIFEKDENGDVSVAWKGRLSNISPDMESATFIFESIFTSLRRSGLRARHQKTCRHAVYGRGCNLNPEDFAVAGTLTALSGRVVTVTGANAYDDGYFTGGMLREPGGSLAYIVDHTGNNLTLQRVTALLAIAIALPGSLAVTLYPGCDHTLNTCWTKFNNGLNCGCFKWIPSKNPYGGSSIV